MLAGPTGGLAGTVQARSREPVPPSAPWRHLLPSDGGGDASADRYAASEYRRSIVGSMKGDRVEAMVDTGQGVQTFEIVATRAGRRIEVVTSRGVVEVREVTRTGQPVRTGRFMTSRLIALVEHPAIDERGRVEVTTRHRLQARDRP